MRWRGLDAIVATPATMQVYRQYEDVRLAADGTWSDGERAAVAVLSVAADVGAGVLGGLALHSLTNGRGGHAAAYAAAAVGTRLVPFTLQAIIAAAERIYSGSRPPNQ